MFDDLGFQFEVKYNSIVSYVCYIWNFVWHWIEHSVQFKCYKYKPNYSPLLSHMSRIQNLADPTSVSSVGVNFSLKKNTRCIFDHFGSDKKFHLAAPSIISSN